MRFLQYFRRGGERGEPEKNTNMYNRINGIDDGITMLRRCCRCLKFNLKTPPQNEQRDNSNNNNIVGDV